MGNDRTRFSPPESQLRKQSLALANSNMHLILFRQMMAQELSIPESLTVLKLSWRLTQVPLQLPPNDSIQSRRPTWTGDFLKTTETVLLKALYPVLHRASTVPEQIRHVGAAETRRDH